MGLEKMTDNEISAEIKNLRAAKESIETRITALMSELLRREPPQQVVFAFENNPCDGDPTFP